MGFVVVPGLDQTFASSNPPTTFRYYRDIVGPSATATVGLANRLNSLLSRQGRVLFSHATNFGLHSTFDSGTTSTITSYRWALTTGPGMTKIRAHFVFLPTPAAVSGTTFARLTMRDGLTSTGSSHTLSPIIVGQHDSDSDYNDLIDIEQDITVGVETTYRFELSLANELRLVSVTMFEVPTFNGQVNTATVSSVVSTQGIIKGKPITSDQVFGLINAADKLWRNGKTLGAWTSDFVDPQTRTSATQANFVDLTTTVTSLTSGWPIALPHSATLKGANIPVTFYVYAGTSGTGTVSFRTASTTLATISVTVAGWYATTGVIADDTTKIDVYFAGDATNALSLYAAGIIQHNEEDITPVPDLSWLPVRPHYMGWVDEVITKQGA